MSTDLQQTASKLLKPLGFEVLEILVTGSGSKGRILLRIDRLDQQAVSIDDVILATEVFGLELDRINPFDNSYKFEVESPGPKRPLITVEHFKRFQGSLVKVQFNNKLTTEIFKGRIHLVEDELITFEVNNKLKQILISDIDSARLAE